MIRDGLGKCAFYRYVTDGEQPGTCSMDAGCAFYGEPRCITEEPEGGWLPRDAATGRFVAKEET